MFYNDVQNVQDECHICGEADKYKFSIKLSCGHKYHYECIMRTFECDKDTSNGKKKYSNYCPYCSKDIGLLPIVNGLTSVIKGIHYNINDEKPTIDHIKCKAIIQSGKNRGTVCNRNCILGYNYCKLHKKNIT